MITPKPIDPVDLDRLERFLAAPERPEGTLSLAELHGFLFAIACSPETIPFSETFEIMFGEEGPGFADMTEAQGIFDVLMDLYNEVNAGAMYRTPRLLDRHAFRGDPLSNLEPDAPVSLWARGFFRGHDWLADIWVDLIPDGMEEELAISFGVLTFFRSREVAEHIQAGFDVKNRTLEAFAEVMIGDFPIAMATYADIGRSIHEALMAGQGVEGAGGHPTETPVSPFAGVGRNDPCPCGSGRKFKRCCGGVGH